MVYSALYGLSVFIRKLAEILSLVLNVLYR